MLMLARNEGQAIRLTGGIVIVVNRARNGKAKIGIVAPEGINIAREELPGDVEVPRPPKPAPPIPPPVDSPLVYSSTLREWVRSAAERQASVA